MVAPEPIVKPVEVAPVQVQAPPAPIQEPIQPPKPTVQVPMPSVYEKPVQAPIPAPVVYEKPAEIVRPVAFERSAPLQPEFERVVINLTLTNWYLDLLTSF